MTFALFHLFHFVCFSLFAGLGALAGAMFGHLASPAGHCRVIAAQKDVGHLHAAKDARPRVLRVLQPPRLAMGLLRHAVRVAEHAGDVPHDRVDDHHRRHLAAVADEVADRYFARLQPEPDALVEALVAPAQQEQSLLLRQFPDERLVKAPPGGRQQDELTGIFGQRPHRLDRVEDRPRHDDHARPAAEGAVVNALVLARRPIADVPQVNLDELLFQGQLQKALGKIALKDLREQGQHIKAHARSDCKRGASASEDDAQASPVLGGLTPPARLDRRVQAWAGGGVSAGAAGAAAWAAACSHLARYFFRNTATFSDGRAPTDSQYLIRAGFSRTRSSVFLTVGS